MSRSAPNPEIDIDDLIQSLGPLNNAYRAAVRSRRVPGAKVLEIMWDAGDALVQAGVRKPDPVAWAMYGRPGEPRRSYITRDFTCSCFRVRRYFPDRGDIGKQFPGLRTHNIFKLALPLLDNEKYAVNGEEKRALLALMNSAEEPAVIKRRIQAMKRARIAPRPAKAKRNRDLDAAAGQVKARHAELAEITATRNRRRLRSLRKRVGDENLLLLSKLCLSVFSEEFEAPAIIDDPGITGLWHRFYVALTPIAGGSPADRNRLRRRSGALVFVEMAEMLSAARTGAFVEGDGGGAPHNGDTP